MLGPRLRCQLLALSVVSTISLLVTVIFTGLYLGFNRIKRNFIEENIIIRPGSLSMDFLMQPSDKGLLKFWFFNVTNADKIGPLVKPKLQAIGPYVYRERTKPFDFRWSSDGKYTSLTYSIEVTYEFEKTLSVGDSENDVLFTAKIPDITVSSFSEKFLPYSKIRKTMKHFLKPILKTTPHKLLWGYEDKMLKLCNRLAPNLCTMTAIGLLLGKQSSVQGPYTIDTGVRERAKLGFLLEARGKSELDVWSHSEANQFTGPLNAFTPPDVTVGSYRDIFAEQLCRSITFKVTDTLPHPSFEHFKVLKMSLLPETFHSAIDYPPNRKYLLNSTVGPEVPPTGVVDLSKCLAVGNLQVPIFGSLPFFRDASVEVSEKVDFLTTPPLGSDIDLKVEPQTGLILEGSTRLQFNIYSRGSKNRGVFREFPDDIFLPIAYASTYQVGSKEEVEKLHYLLDFLPNVLMNLLLSLLCIALLAIVSALTIFYVLLNRVGITFTYLFFILRSKIYLQKIFGDDDARSVSPEDITVDL